MIIYQNTYDAMVSRGYKGKIILHSRRHFTLKDLAVLAIITLAGIIFILIEK
jgi:energy-coupling factor transporter transmembrane protein EcfT